MPLIYYKGYQAIINGEVTNTYKTSNGLVGIDIDNIESGEIYIYYRGTTLQMGSRLISFVTLMILLLVMSIKKRGEVHEK